MEPAGQQRYEARLAAQLGDRRDVLLNDVSFGGLRSPLPVDRHIPLHRLTGAPASVRRLAGRVVYPRSRLVHRLDLRLPPAPNEVLTVHDVAPLLFDDEGSLPPSSSIEARRAAAVVAPSRYAAAEITRALGRADVYPIHNGVDQPPPRVEPLSSDERMALIGAPRFVLHTGGATRRKNLIALRDAWSALSVARPDVALLLCGPGAPVKRDMFAGCAGVRVLERVDDVLLHRLRRSAVAICVPSIYEGFGLPAVEGMAAGTPVVAARAAALPEICGDGAVLVPPTPDGLVHGLAAILDTADLSALVQRGLAQAARFSWDRCAAEHLEVYRRVEAHSRNRHADPGGRSRRSQRNVEGPRTGGAN